MSWKEDSTQRATSQSTAATLLLVAPLPPATEAQLLGVPGLQGSWVGRISRASDLGALGFEF